MNEELIQTMLNSIMQDLSQVKKDIEELKKAKPQTRPNFSGINPNKPAPGSLADQLAKVNYKTLMAEAHKIGIRSTSVELVPELTNMSEKKACFKATVVIARKTIDTETKVETIDFQTFEDYGEACGSDVKGEANIDSENIRPAYIRMASTRALVRALRQATNNMETADEEMPEGKLPEDN